MGGGNGMKSKTARERKQEKGGAAKELTPEEAKRARDLRTGVGQAERMAAAAAERAANQKKREEKKAGGK